MIKKHKAPNNARFGFGFLKILDFEFIWRTVCFGFRYSDFGFSFGDFFAR